jgi:hypothetical protein
MTRPDISRAALDGIAESLRQQASAASETAARAEADNRTGDAEHWAGRSDALTEAHGLITGLLGNDQVTYHILATLTWPRGAGSGMWSCDRIFTTEAPVTRSDVLQQVFEYGADEANVPDTANVLFFSIEIDEVRR